MAETSGLEIGKEDGAHFVIGIRVEFDDLLHPSVPIAIDVAKATQILLVLALLIHT